MSFQPSRSQPHKSARIAESSAANAVAAIPTNNRFAALAGMQSCDADESSGPSSKPSPSSGLTPSGNASDHTHVKPPHPANQASEGRSVAEIVNSCPPADDPDRKNTHDATKRSTTISIVGDSMVRGLAPLIKRPGLESIGYVYPGRTARQINARIRNIEKTDITVIAVGTNNIAGQSVDECKAEMYAVIDNVSKKRHDGHVIMCEIPYRFDKPELNAKIDEVNSYVASEITNRSNWRLLQHECITESDYKKDKLHFKESGTALFALEIRHMTRLIFPE